MFHPFPACAFCYCSSLFSTRTLFQQCYCSSLFTGTSPLINEITLIGCCLEKENFTLLVLSSGKGDGSLAQCNTKYHDEYEKDGKVTKQEVHKSSLTSEKNDQLKITLQQMLHELCLSQSKRKCKARNVLLFLFPSYLLQTA